MHIEGFACILWALMLLTLPLAWLASAFLAAVFHELCHIIAIMLTGGKIHGIHMGTGGIVIETGILSNGQELICALAGPAGSLFLLLFTRWIPRIGVCALVQALFNLMPVYPMDGGRVLRCCLLMFCDDVTVNRTCRIIQWTIFAAIGIASILLTRRLELGVFPIIIALVWILRVLVRKRPCKDSQIAVQ